MINFFRTLRHQLLGENKFTRYLLYAAGEIILVVIGILIALQINTWNQNQKREVAKNTYTNSLMNDLALDTLMLNELIDLNLRELQVLNHQRSRLLGPSSPVDTLIHIARYEFDPNLDIHFQYHRNTLNTLVASGNIDLFTKDFNQRLLALIAEQDIERADSKYLSEVYSSKVSRFSDTYPVSGHLNSNVVDFIWTDINKKDLASKFVSLTDIKGFAHYSFIEHIKKVKQKTTALIMYINEKTP